MRRLTLSIAFVSFLGPTTILAAGMDARWTGGMMNGLMWRQMDDAAKTYYVAGILELSSTIENKDQGAIINLDKSSVMLHF